MACNSESLQLYLADEAATVAFGTSLAKAAAVSLDGPLIIFLQGDLGAGKTTCSRGFLQGLGHTGSVKSPTYTLVEPYQQLRVPVFHFDLYRLADPEELEYLGFRDYLLQSGILLIEWPQKGVGYLPNPDLTVNVKVKLINEVVGREAELQAHTEIGKQVLKNL